jgi:hypothetical protein
VKFSLPTNTYAYSLFTYATSFLKIGLLGSFDFEKLGQQFRNYDHKVNLGSTHSIKGKFVR